MTRFRIACLFRSQCVDIVYGVQNERFHKNIQKRLFRVAVRSLHISASCPAHSPVGFFETWYVYSVFVGEFQQKLIFVFYCSFFWFNRFLLGRSLFFRSFSLLSFLFFSFSLLYIGFEEKLWVAARRQSEHGTDAWLPHCFCRS